MLLFLDFIKVQNQHEFGKGDAVCPTKPSILERKPLKPDRSDYQ
jgi:hypothetical protein